MASKQQTFEGRQRDATGVALASNAAKLRSPVEEMRGECEIIAADAEAFDEIERNAYRECVAGLNAWAVIMRQLAGKLSREAGK